MTGDAPVVQHEPNRDGLFELLLDCRWLMLVAFLICGVAAFFLSTLVRPAYRAEALVVPAQAGNSSLSGALSSLVAATAMTNLGMAPTASKNEALATLQSRSLLRQFIVERNLLPVFCRSRAMDCRVAGDNPALAAEREMEDAIQLFQDDLLGVSEDTVTGAIYISVTWYDRALAADWSNGLIAATNQRMQASAGDLASKRIRYLQQEFARTDVVPVQAAVATLLQTELSRALDASTRPDYALRVVDPAVLPDDRNPVRPRKAVIGSVAGVGGALLVLLQCGLRSRRSEQ